LSESFPQDVKETAVAIDKQNKIDFFILLLIF
jgi:hypothetical protein